MRFISVRDLRGKSGEIWQGLSKEKEMIITSNGKPIALLFAISEENLEESLTAARRARAILAVESMQRKSVEAGVHKLTSKEIEEEIKADRSNRPQ